MRVAIVAVALVSSSLGVFLACSSDTPDPIGAGGDAGSESSTTDTGAVDTGAVDSGIIYSPTGCPIKSTDLMIGAKAENIPIANGADWTNVNGALSEDGDFASITLNDGQTSAELRVSEFGFTLPEDAETWGIKVQLKRRAPDGGIADDKIDVLIEGKPTIFKYVASDKDGGRAPWPTSIVGTHNYGQEIDTWGVDLFASDVNKKTFAARLTARRAKDAPSGPVTGIVDSLKVSVHYCTK